jgi:hypothetical protein
MWHLGAALQACHPKPGALSPHLADHAMVLTDVHGLFMYSSMRDDPNLPTEMTNAATPSGGTSPVSPVAPQATPLAMMLPGMVLARGVCRHLLGHNFVTVTEFVPTPGLRVDVLALGPKGEVWVIECKSGRADFHADRKWQGYLDWCDRFFWAVDADFPTDLLPLDTGLMVADGYDADIIRMAPEVKLAGARRKTMVQAFARHAALRWHQARDPGINLSVW